MKDISFQNDILPLKNELFRLALRITQNHAEAEDAVQDTMLRVWRRRSEWPTIENIEAFCLTICRNVALDKVRRMEAQNVSLDSLSSATGESTLAGPSPTNPEQQAVQRDRVRLVQRLMEQLPEKQRTAMHLRDIEGKSYRDIAQVMGISEQQVKVSIFRARQTVKQRFLKIQ